MYSLKAGLDDFERCRYLEIRLPAGTFCTGNFYSETAEMNFIFLTVFMHRWKGFAYVSPSNPFTIKFSSSGL